MADQITYKLKEDIDYSQYEFELDNNEYKFDVVLFNGIDEYNSYLKPNDPKIFDKIEKIKHKIYKVVSYDWDIKKNNDDVDIFQLVRLIELIGKDYVIRHWPDVIFYMTDDPRLHTIYQRMFSSFGYNYLYEIENHHVFLRDFGSSI